METAQQEKRAEADVTVVVVHWNNPAHLLRCLQALTTQSVAPRRIMVVDNASDELPRNMVADFPEVEWIWNSTNLGFATAVNQAVRLTDSNWLATVNPDAFVRHDWLEQIMRAAGENRSFDFFASTLIRDDGRVDGAGDAFHMSGMAWRKQHGQPIDRLPAEPVETFAACAAAALFRRSAFLEVEGMDGRYFCYFEDVDLAIRLRAAGYRCLYVPLARATHLGGGSGVSRALQVYYGHRNLIWTYWKNVPWPRLITSLPLHVFYQLASLFWHSWHGQTMAIWRAKWDGLVGLLRLRREAKPRNGVSLDLAETGWLAPIRK